jgi:hypothetical protein
MILISAVIPVSPGESIQDALDTAVPGDTVLLLPGVHTGTGDHLISMNGSHDGVILLGDVESPSLVTVDGSSLSGSIAHIDGLNQGDVGPGTLIAGITFSGAQLTDVSLGGGLHSLYASPTVLRCFFEDNSADCGGGAYVWRGAPSFISCQFTDNQCVTAGAGLYAYSCGSDCRIISSTFTGNWSPDDGGGIYLYHASPEIHNGLVTDNYAWDNGGGIYCYGQSDPDIGFCTFWGNEVSYEGSAVYFRQGSSPVLHDNIAVGNIGPAFWIDGGGSPSFSHNCVWGNSGGNYGNIPDPTGSDGNISEDPLFTGGFHLSNQASGQPVTSPCVDAGSDTAYQFGLHIYWTRTDSVPDDGTADMGFHYGPQPDQMSSGEGVSPHLADQLLIFPNPCSGTLTLGPLSPDDVSEISVYDIRGRLVSSEVTTGSGSVLLTLPDLEAGIYLMRVVSEQLVRSGLFSVVSR